MPASLSPALRLAAEVADQPGAGFPALSKPQAHPYDTGINKLLPTAEVEDQGVPGLHVHGQPAEALEHVLQSMKGRPERVRRRRQQAVAGVERTVMQGEDGNTDEQAALPRTSTVRSSYSTCWLHSGSRRCASSQARPAASSAAACTECTHGAGGAAQRVGAVVGHHEDVFLPEPKPVDSCVDGLEPG